MSRLIVKNLPSYVTPERLKEHFARSDGPGGTLTDVKVAFKQDGTSRRFGFVGFGSEEQAQKAQQWFDRTFIGTTKIQVVIVDKGAKEAPAPRPNKRPRLGPPPEEASTSKLPQNAKKPSSADSPPIVEKTAQLDDFMKVMKPRNKKVQSWANEDVGALPTAASNTREANGLEESNQASLPNQTNDDAAEMDDLEWLKRRMAGSSTLSSSGEGEAVPLKHNAAIIESNSPDLSTPESAKALIQQTSRLFLRNLAFSCGEDDLRGLFQPYGEISQIHIPLDRMTKVHKGLAYVTFSDADSAVAAYEALDKTSFQGRLVHILPAVSREGAEKAKEGENAAVKADKAKKRKQDAGKEFNWSMLYMNSDAVASSIADRLGIPKADILNSENEADMKSAAVKLALAETHIIQETKSFLEAEGINIASFGDLASSKGRPRRSDTTILVKNIPYGTTQEQIHGLFEPYGALGRVLVPPAGTIAVVEFTYPDDAAKAFKGVAYRRMGSSIVYLEKAPLGVFKDSLSESIIQKSSSGTKTHPPVTLPDDDSPSQDFENVVPGSTLFIKNLSFATTSERLTQVFKHLPSFTYARIQTKPNTKSPNGPRLSMGYGFVGLKSPEAAKKAMNGMNGFVLDGHSLSVKFAGRGAEEEESDQKGKGSSAKTTKMLVKNVPFEATKKDIRDLFAAYGQLKSVRLPKRFDARSRGFAFIDFVSRHEAENAYAALRHTHLLGRHLVLEWAESGSQDVELLRQKAGLGLGDGGELPGKKRKLQLREEDGVDEDA